MFCKLFKNNTSIVDAENLLLPCTSLKEYVYSSMFEGCTNLVNPPKELPDATLTYSSTPYPYQNMFKGCTSLVKSPYIKSNLGSTVWCTGMFDGCSNLSEIKLDYTGNFSQTYFSNWVNGVAATGTFYYNGSDTNRGVSAIPTGWTITPFTTT